MGAFKSVEDFRRWADELDRPNCPVAIRTRELQEEREREARKAREAREQQQRAANVLQSQLEVIDQRIADHMASQDNTKVSRRDG